MYKLKKISKILTFLEEKLEVKFQLTILNEKKIITPKNENIIDVDDLKGCYSTIHNTKNLECLYFYKKNF